MGSVEKQGIGNGWPVGFGFRPTDDELIHHHLTRKLRGLKADGRVIPELNIYHWEPQTLFEKYNELSEYPSDGGECFFYCTMNGKNRMTKSGFWKETKKKHTFRGCDGEENGSKRIFVYHEGRQPYGRRSSFSMHEYHLNCCANSKIRADQGPAKEFVLCRIINRKIKKIKPDSPSECLEPDLVTPGCTAANQGDKDNEASSQVCDSPSECLEPDLVTPGFTAANQGDKDNEASPQVCDPQHNLTEAEAGGDGDCSEMNLLQYYESICSEHQFLYNDQIDGPVNYIDDGFVFSCASDDGVFINELWG